MERSDLSERLLDYAVRIIKLVESLPNTIIGRRIGDQLLRSGTSPGANYEEAQEQNRTRILPISYKLL